LKEQNVFKSKNQSGVS